VPPEKQNASLRKKGVRDSKDWVPTAADDNEASAVIRRDYFCYEREARGLACMLFKLVIHSLPRGPFLIV
jgi:hypothetical protein